MQWKVSKVCIWVFKQKYEIREFMIVNLWIYNMTEYCSPLIAIHCNRAGVQLWQNQDQQPGDCLWLQLCDALWKASFALVTQKQDISFLDTPKRLVGLWQLNKCASGMCLILECLCGFRFAFSKNREPTIIPIPDNNVSIGKAEKMSSNDILRINTLYCSMP